MRAEIAPVVEFTETICDIVVVGPSEIEFVNSIEYISAYLGIWRRRPAALVLVAWDVRPDGHQIRQTIPCDHDITCCSKGPLVG